MKDEVLIKGRIRLPRLLEKLSSADAAAEFVKDGMTVGMSGFTLAGGAKSVPHAIARRANSDDFKITLLTGASLGNEVDSALTKAGVMARRSPFQTDRTLRDAINRGEVMYFDISLKSDIWNRKHRSSPGSSGLSCQRAGQCAYTAAGCKMNRIFSTFI